MKKHIFKLFGVVLLLILMSIITGCTKKQVIDFKNTVNFNFTGFNSMGKVNVVIDENIYDDKEFLEQLFPDSSLRRAKKKLNDLMANTKYLLSKESNLSNGDKIVVTVEYDKDILEENDIEIQNKEFMISVEGLVDCIELDPFEKLEITYMGVSPYVKASIDSTKCDSMVNEYIRFDIEDDYLRNGDTFTVSAVYNEYDAEEYGFKVTSESHTYTVEKQPEFVTSLEGFDLKPLQSELDDKLTVITTANEGDSWFANVSFWGSFQSIIEQKHVASYLISLKPSFEEKYNTGFFGGYKYNRYIKIYEYTIDIKNKEKTIYVAVCADNISISNDNVISWDVELDSWGYDDYDRLVNELITSKKEYYNVSEIKNLD